MASAEKPNVPGSSAPTETSPASVPDTIAAPVESSVVEPSALPSFGLVPCDHGVRISSSSTVREMTAPVRTGISSCTSILNVPEPRLMLSPSPSVAMMKAERSSEVVSEFSLLPPLAWSTWSFSVNV
jgi:hypothetical protein